MSEEPEVPSRELPNGRGWLRAVDGGKGVWRPASPSPAAAFPATAERSPQLTIFDDWKPPADR